MTASPHSPATRPVWVGLAVVLGLALPTSSAFTSLAALIPLAWVILHPAAARAAWQAMLPEARLVAKVVALLLGVILVWAAWSHLQGHAPLRTLSRHSKMVFFLAAIPFLGLAGHRRGFLIGFGLGALASLLASLYAAASGHLFLHAQAGDYAIFRDHIRHNLLLAVALYGLVALLLVEARPWRQRWALWLLAGLATVDVLFLVAGRTGQLLLPILALLLLTRRPRQLASVAAFLVAGLAVGVALLHESSTLGQRVQETWRDYSGYQSSEAQLTSTGMRLQYYQYSLAVIRQGWLAGHGTGSFDDEYKRHALAQGTPYTPTDNPHSDFLFFWLENGLLGLGLVIVLHLAAARAALAMEEPRRLLLLGLTAAFVTAGLLNTTLLDHASGFLYFSLLALLLAGPWPWPLKADAAPAPPPRPDTSA